MKYNQFNFSETDDAFIYLLYGSDPSSENLVRFATLQRLNQLNEKFDKLLELLQDGAIETYTMQE